MIRIASKQDLPAIMELIHELARYEKAPHEVTNTVEMMLQDGFGKQPIYHAFVAESDQLIIGFAIVYFRYSTWKGKCLYLEDLIITEKYRQLGFGQHLFDRCLQFGRENKCSKLVWQVLDWNEPAIRFYKKNQAILDPEWINGSIDL